ncbi:MAG: small nuclear ribonucleoprotein [Candidatus ainarchaeum sp.]|nr:small nuclear ribonucleoprotein [Candidatus ainarchaeum sp.]
MENRPFDLLNNAINKEVLIVLKGGRQIRGLLKAYDVHMNLHLENANELVDGEMKTNYGKVFVRGDNVILITP